MTTAEDVFWIYEHKNIDIDNQIVLPTIIGDIEVPCHFKRKTYIVPGQECPICMESILRKADAYLTSCGHGFHKKCIFNAFHTKIEDDCFGLFQCPMCRSKMGDVCIQGKYNVNSNEFTILDELENYWLQKDFTMCVLCNSDYEHYQGMKLECESCIKYRES